ncbi:MAG: hypothetical protein Q9161_003762 [Pseudevernia consocians]
MILLDTVRLLAEDQAEFSAQPHPTLRPHERVEWNRDYARLMSPGGRNANPDDPENRGPRAALRALRQKAVSRHNSLLLPKLAPAPPRPHPGPPNPGMPPA